MDADDFVLGLLREVFLCFTETVEFELEISPETRCVPEDFPQQLVVFSQVFVEKLMADMKQMPSLLCCSEDLFKRFTNSVCMRLIRDVDPEVGFLKVMAFMMVIITMSFMLSCYRSLDDIPKILKTLLREHIETNFYEENGFDAISLRSQNLKEDDNWCNTTVEEMRTCIHDSMETELPATKDLPHYEYNKRIEIKIDEMGAKKHILTSNSTNCPYCAKPCNLLLKAFFGPKIKYKPGYEPME